MSKKLSPQSPQSPDGSDSESSDGSRSTSRAPWPVKALAATALVPLTWRLFDLAERATEAKVYVPLFVVALPEVAILVFLFPGISARAVELIRAWRSKGD